MVGEAAWESESLAWLHRIRDEHYQKTKRLPLEDWLKPVEAAKAARACRRLGLKVRLAQPWRPALQAEARYRRRHGTGYREPRQIIGEQRRTQ